MESILQTLHSWAQEAFAACGYDKSLAVVSPSDRADLCQFQCNGAFAGAKLYHKAPLAIAGEVAAELGKNPAFSSVQAMKPGFINMTLNDDYLLRCVNAIAKDEHLGVTQANPPATIVIDYGGPNVAKPLHIGHLRSAIIGESLKRLARATGNRVIGDVHLGDWGLQIGLVIAELEERNPDWDCFSPAFAQGGPVPTLDIDLLSEVYPLASKKSKTDPAFMEKAHRITYEMQNGRPGYVALWKEILRASVADLKQNYSKLGVDFDLWYGESDAEPYIPKLMEILGQKELLRESDGALVVDVAREDDKAPMPPVIVKKSDNSNIYATTDLATILQRQEEFAPNEIWYVVDKRQGLHFEQVFRCAHKAGLVPDDTKLSFLGFGTMNGPDGKPYKTRDGGVMRLSDLLETVRSAAARQIESSEFVAEEDKAQTAERIGIAAVKFGDLINHRSKDYIFDLDKFLSFEGKTGVYLLYTVTRVNSILKRAGVDPEKEVELKTVSSQSDRDLLLNILMTDNAFAHAMEEKAPNYICENAYQLAAAFSRFYNDHHILNEPDPVRKGSWIDLIVLTRRLLLKQLDILGIDAVDNM